MRLERPHSFGWEKMVCIQMAKDRTIHGYICFVFHLLPRIRTKELTFQSSIQPYAATVETTVEP